MKLLIVFVAIFAYAVARPNNAEVLKLLSDVGPDGYTLDVETSDGTSRHEDAKVKDVGSEHPALVVHGSYSWNDEHGHPYTVTFVADENGYQPSGAHLPQQPKVVLDPHSSHH